LTYWNIALNSKEIQYKLHFMVYASTVKC